jgi:hypothetical protein
MLKNNGTHNFRTPPINPNPPTNDKLLTESGNNLTQENGSAILV